jgi:hypothetical protein
MAGFAYASTGKCPHRSGASGRNRVSATARLLEPRAGIERAENMRTTMPEHQVSELTGEKLEAAVVEMFREDPDARVIRNHNEPSRPGDAFYAYRGDFDGQYGATEAEAVQRLFVFEAFGDVVELPE